MPHTNNKDARRKQSWWPFGGHRRHVHTRFDFDSPDLRTKYKMLCRQNGAQGQTIHNLRAELALVRLEHSRIERGELRTLDRDLARLKSINADLQRDNVKLFSQIADASPEPPQPLPPVAGVDDFIDGPMVGEWPESAPLDPAVLGENDKDAAADLLLDAADRPRQ